MSNQEIVVGVYVVGAVITFLAVFAHLLNRARKNGLLITLAQVMEISEVYPDSLNAITLFLIYPLFFAITWPGLVVTFLFSKVEKFIPN